MFYWPVSSPFAILHVDLRSPGHQANHNSNIVLMNIMYDIIKFAVVVPVSDETSTTLANHFMQYFLLKFGMYHLFVLDDVILLKDPLSLCARL